MTATLPLAEAARRPWDVAVVGAGPAGALAAALLARRGVSVLLADRASFPRRKVCGCCLNVAALRTLAAVGLGELPGRLGAVPLGRVLTAGRGCRAELPLPGGAALSREALDAALVKEAIRAGAAFLPQTVAALGPANGESRSVVLVRDGERMAVEARLVLAADGLGGRLLAGGAPAPGSRVGAGAVADDGPSFYAAGAVYMACAEGGYVGLVRLEDARLDIAAAFDLRAVRDGGPGEAARRVLREVGWPPVPGLADLPWRGTPALTRRGARPAGERVLVIGDAAGYVEPFTGEGIAWALASAVAVAPLAARPWHESVGREWAARHRRVVTGRQSTCRVVASVLRKPLLARAAIRLLGCLPGLAAPVLRQLNAPSSPLPEVPGRGAGAEG